MKNGEKSPVMIDVIRLSRAFDLSSRHIMNRIEWEKTTVRHTVRCYDYLSDNLTDDFVTFIGCNTLIDKNLR